jgi:uncharacterized protein YndB with AHSA1/START domain
MTERERGMVLRKSVRVARPPEQAFRLYTDGISTWWPLATHSVAEGDADTVVFESGPGGRIYERAKDGTEHLWGTVTVWEPPERFVHTWHPGRPEATRQLVEMRFLPDGHGTRVEVVHTGWEELGDEAPRTYASYDTGWDYVLDERYAPTAA